MIIVKHFKWKGLNVCGESFYKRLANMCDTIRSELPDGWTVKEKTPFFCLGIGIIRIKWLIFKGKRRLGEIQTRDIDDGDFNLKIKDASKDDEKMLLRLAKSLGINRVDVYEG